MIRKQNAKKRAIVVAIILSGIVSSTGMAEEKALTAPSTSAPTGKSVVLTAPGAATPNISGAISAPSAPSIHPVSGKVLSAPSSSTPRMGQAPIVSQASGTVTKGKAEVLNAGSLDKVKRTMPSNLVLPSSPTPVVSPDPGSKPKSN
jgi:hypothetical protein